jgi:hypothetical protein
VEGSAKEVVMDETCRHDHVNEDRRIRGRRRRLIVGRRGERFLLGVLGRFLQS